MPTALEIARNATLKPISEIAEEIGIPPWLIEQHGEHVAKIDLKAIAELQDRPKAKYVVVTAITPTPLGEGKTTTTIGLGDACLLYTSDAADDLLCVDLGGRRI